MRMLVLLHLSLTATMCLGTAVRANTRHSRTQDAYLQKMEGRFDPMHEECEISQDERQQCGRKTYSEQECQTRGCCWEVCDSADCTDVPWCFVAKRMLREECAIDYELRLDCGYHGITEGECFMRDCCWRPSPLPNAPSCFYKKTIRLVDGPNEAAGRVEILHEGQWGTICAFGFSQPVSDVICGSMGYSYSRSRGYDVYPVGSGIVWFHGAHCLGSELRLEDCNIPEWGTPCPREYSVGLDCSNVPFDTTTPESSTSSHEATMH